MNTLAGCVPGKPLKISASPDNGPNANRMARKVEESGLDSALDMRGKPLVEKCNYPWYNLMIDVDGEVRPCCWVAASWGNLNSKEFDEIWNGPSAVSMRQSFLADRVPVPCRKKHCRVDL